MRDVLGVLLAAHIICMLVSAVNPLTAVWCEYREGRGDVLAGVVGRWLLAMALLLFVAGAVLGLLVGWIDWQGGLGSALERLPSKVFFGIIELVFSAVLILVHWQWWRRVTRPSGTIRSIRAMLGILAGTNLLYHFPVLFAVIRHLIHQGEAVGDVLSAGDFRVYLADPAVGSRVIHVVLASVVGGGMALLAGVNLFSLHRKTNENLRGEESSKVSTDEPTPGDSTGAGEPPTDSSVQETMSPEHATDCTERDRRRITAWGARLALLAGVAQLPTGLWVFTQLSPVGQSRLMGGDWLASLYLVLGITTAFWMLHLLASLCLGEDNRRLSRRAILAFVLTMILMTLSSRRVIVEPATSAHVDFIPRSHVLCLAGHSCLAGHPCPVGYPCRAGLR